MLRRTGRRRVAPDDPRDGYALAEDGEIPASPGYAAAVTLRREVIEAQREELLRWRDSGRLPDASLRILEHELDLEERTLPRSQP